MKRKLPYNLEAEQLLLGAMIVNGNLYFRIADFLLSEHFFEPLHQKTYNAIRIVTERGLSVSIVSVVTILEKEQSFQEAGGSEYLAKLATMAIVIVDPVDLAKIVHHLAIKRQLIEIGEEIVNEAYDPSIEYGAVEQLEHAESKLFELATRGNFNARTFVPLSGSIVESIRTIDKAIKNPDHISGISTGLADLDKKLSGFHNSDLIIVAGRPSMGKTAFALNFAINACKALTKRVEKGEAQKSVAIFSLEMSSEQIAVRYLSMLTRIESTALRNGKVSEEHYNRLRKAGDELSKMPIFIDDTPALTISAIRARARRLKRKENLGIIFVDYLQLLTVARKIENRVLEISEITQGLKAIAKELDVPVIALSQLSRAVEQREDKRPVLSDLRESGSIEQDADIVMFIYREQYYLARKEPPQNDPKYGEWQKKQAEAHNIAELFVAKHRNGSIGNVKVRYEDTFSIVENLAY